VGAWHLMGGKKDDFFIYRSGGRLSPGGYFDSWGPVNTNLSTDEGYRTIFNAVVAASTLGPGDPCPDAPPPGGLQLPGNFNQDASLDISDAIALLGYLFAGSPVALPCEATGLDAEGNQALMDVNADGDVDLADAVYLLNFLFTGGTSPVAGTDCVRLTGCSEACRK